ncbi:VPA1269 family protein [Microvirga sp. P5_D2]
MPKPLPASTWQTDNFAEATSYLTGRTIRRNTDPTRVLLCPETHWESARVQALICGLRMRWCVRTPARLDGKTSKHVWKLLTKLGDKGDSEAVCEFLEAILPQMPAWSGHVKAPWKDMDRTLIKEVLVGLKACDAIAFPAKTGFLRYTRMDCHKEIIDPLVELAARMDHTGNGLSILHQYIRNALLSRTGVIEVGDLTPEVIPDDPGKARFSFFHLLCVAQRDKFGNSVVHNENSYAVLIEQVSKKKTRDLQFRWTTKDRPEMEDWRRAAAEYLEQLGLGNLTAPRTALAAFLDYVIDNPGVPRNPVAYLTQSLDSVPIFTGPPKLGENVRHVKSFLDWIIKKKLTSEDDAGRPILLPGTVNPLAEVRHARRAPSESVREAMPPKLMRRAIAILTESDWAFARQRNARGSIGDWFQWCNPKTGYYEEIWSPVRAVALYVKLRMPFRTIQVRTMDDGSADTMIYDAKRKQMVLNKGPLASGSRKKPIQRGAIQAVQDLGSARTILSCRITTNKTADVNKDAWAKGYLCPWLPDDVSDKLLFLTEWQTMYNPIERVTPWRKLREFEHTKLDDVLVGMENCFLFRNPKNNYGRKDEPITNDDVMWLWLRVNLELERRLEVEGQVGLDGQPIRLITSYNITTGQPATALYDLHALRVSIITNLLETGEISPEMMMKVVGHATVVMVMYYTKHSNVLISDCLYRADKRSLETEQENWVRHLRSMQYKDLRKAVIANSETGAERFASAASGNLLRLFIGVCPVGGTQCHVGGAKMTSRVNEQVYGPIPGGRSNCAGCRFLITGEPFLHGIHAEFNTRSFENTGLQRTRDAVDDRFEVLEAQRRQCELSGVPFPEFRDLDRASDDLAEIDARLAQLGTEMANLMALEAQTRRLVDEQRRAGATRLALVTGDFDSVRIALMESTEIDLADRLCDAADFYPSIAARGNLTELAAYFRGQRYDRALRRERLDPRFYDMDPGTSIYVGNRLMQYLELNIGRSATLRVLDGENSLSDECRSRGLLPEAFVAQFAEVIENSLADRVRMPKRSASESRYLPGNQQ